MSNTRFVRRVDYATECPPNRISVWLTSTLGGSTAPLTSDDRYGLWLGISQNANTTSILGSPVNQTIQSLIIEPPMVFVSTITNLAYPTINFILPVQIDMIIRFNDQLKIESYDATWVEDYANPHKGLTLELFIRFRRWPGMGPVGMHGTADNVRFE
jgi:hypothetical protein